MMKAQDRPTTSLMYETDVQQQRNRFNALLKQFGPPDQSVTRDFLAEREVEQPEDEKTAEFIAKVKVKLVG